jgi:hypothetical protein
MCTIYAILLSLTLRYRWVRGGWKNIDIFHAGSGRGQATGDSVQQTTATTLETAD